MAEKTLATRIQLKYDSYTNWAAVEETFIPKKGEICFIEIPGETGAVASEPAVLYKVGDGSTTLKNLPYGAAIAADVYSWAKAASKPSYTADEISGLSDYIAGEIKDTNTTYQLVQDEEDGRKITLQSKEVGDETWTDVATLTIPETEYTLTTGTTAGTVSFNGTEVAVAQFSESIATAQAAALSDAKDYTDGEISSLKEELEAAIEEIEVPEYTIAKVDAADGYAATYQLTKDGTAVGEAINIPKDYLVKSAELKTAAAEDASGFDAGVKYIDFVVNTVDGDGTESHIYLNVADLVDTYTAGTAVEISEANEISVKVVEGNGLSVGDNGIEMALATNAAAGAMSAADKATIEGLAAVATSGNVADLIQTEGDVLVFDCGDSTTNV